jgi:hypothetical protein
MAWPLNYPIILFGGHLIDRQKDSRRGSKINAEWVPEPFKPRGRILGTPDSAQCECGKLGKYDGRTKQT